MTNAFIEAFLSVGTLGGYWMVTHGLVYYGALLGLITNIFWIFYAKEKNSISIGIVNAVFAMINITLISN